MTKFEELKRVIRSKAWSDKMQNPVLLTDNDATVLAKAALLALSGIAEEFYSDEEFWHFDADDCAGIFNDTIAKIEEQAK